MEIDQQMRPVVRLPRPAREIDGKVLHFVPTRERIGQLVKGTVRVVQKKKACMVAADYVSPIEPCHPDVYWFNQSEVNDLFGG